MAAKIVLKSKKDEAVRRYHPWVFSGALKSLEGEPEEGEWVDVYANKGAWLATGHYQSTGSIMVRLLSWQPVTDRKTFYHQKIADALALRTSAGLTSDPDTNAYRLIYAEGDGLPGLVADWYNGCLVIQCHSAGMVQDLPMILDAFRGVLGSAVRSIYLKPLHSDTSVYPGAPWLYGHADETEMTESGIRYMVNWAEGQKTGFFLDQRENRSLVRRLSKCKKVLNCFCYTGGFSLAALKGGASLVHSVDSSAGAIALLEKNMQLNGFDPALHQSITSDALEYLRGSDIPWDLVILDPPAYAKHLSARHNAVQGYKRLNATAMALMPPGSLLMTFSCSQVVDRRLFEATIMAAALSVNREVAILTRLSQPPDHPVSIYHPEGEYLKGLLLMIR